MPRCPAMVFVLVFVLLTVEKTKAKEGELSDLWRRPELRRRSVVSCIVWAAFGFLYYGVILLSAKVMEDSGGCSFDYSILFFASSRCVRACVRACLAAWYFCFVFGVCFGGVCGFVSCRVLCFCCAVLCCACCACFCLIFGCSALLCVAWRRFAWLSLCVASLGLLRLMTFFPLLAVLFCALLTFCEVAMTCFIFFSCIIPF